MATPASGAISMNDMNVEITRASGTATLSMDTIRTRYGGSGAISFNDLRKSEGFQVICGTYSSKYYSFDGFNKSFGIGSVSPNEANLMVQFAANSYMSDMSSAVGSDGAAISMAADISISSITGITTGFKGTDVTRIVTANTSRTLGWATASNSSAYFTYDFPASGTIHCLVKF